MGDAEVMAGRRPRPSSPDFWSRCASRARPSTRSSGFRDAMLERRAAPRRRLRWFSTSSAREATRRGRLNISSIACGGRRGDRRSGGQARQSRRQLGLRGVGRARRARLEPRDAARAVAEVLRETGITFAFAAAVPSRVPPRRPDAQASSGSRRCSTSSGRCAIPRGRRRPRWASRSLDRVPLVVGVFQTRGATALVFRGDDGIDKLTTTGHSHIWEVSAGSSPSTTSIRPTSGIPTSRTSRTCWAADPEHNAAVARTVLAGEQGPVRDIVLLNAAAGICAFELAQDPDSIGSRSSSVSAKRWSRRRRRDRLRSAAAEKLDQWVAATNA